WFPDIAGNGDGYGTLKDIWANYRDESFVLQFLSPAVIRHFGLFHIADREEAEELRVSDIHDERGYRGVRRALSRQYDLSRVDPDINIVDVDLAGDRRLDVQHRALDGVVLAEADAKRVLHYLTELWGYDVRLTEIDAETENVLARYEAQPSRPFGG
ncbi:MAG: SpoVR family protein, partial [Hyphomonadaceae bacterium]